MLLLLSSPSNLTVLQLHLNYISIKLCMVPILQSGKINEK